MNTQSISLDVSKAVAPAPCVRIGQGDASGTTIVATIYDNSQAASLAGMTARFCMRLPNGRDYVRDPNCQVSGSTITYVVDEAHCASVAGATNEAYFELMQGASVVYSTGRFRVEVLRSVLDGTRPAESWDNAVDELIRRGSEALDGYELAEQARASAESDRATAERARYLAESQRVVDEAARASAESRRAQAESARASAESTRAGEWSGISAAATSATSAANTAAGAANAAASGATAAADRATSAAQAAEEAATLSVPLMTATRRGGAMVGDGLAMAGESLGVAMDEADVAAAVAAAFA